MSRQPHESAKEMNHTSPLRETLTALGIGSVSQYVLTHGFPMLGGLGYGIATWIFVSRLRRYPEVDSVDEEQGGEQELLEQEISRIINKFMVVKKNWRQLTISEIIMGMGKPSNSRENFQVSLRKHGVIEEEHDLDANLNQHETGATMNRFMIIKKNWRQMTISEIFSRLFESPEDSDVYRDTFREDD